MRDYDLAGKTDHALRWAVRELRKERNKLPLPEREDFVHQVIAYMLAKIHPNGRSVEASCPIVRLRFPARRKIQAGKRKSSTLM